MVLCGRFPPFSNWKPAHPEDCCLAIRSAFFLVRKLRKPGHFFLWRKIGETLISFLGAGVWRFNFWLMLGFIKLGPSFPLGEWVNCLSWPYKTPICHDGKPKSMVMLGNLLLTGPSPTNFLGLVRFPHAPLRNLGSSTTHLFFLESPHPVVAKSIQFTHGNLGCVSKKIPRGESLWIQKDFPSLLGVIFHIPSGQFITTSAEVTPNGGFVREPPQNGLKLG